MKNKSETICLSFSKIKLHKREDETMKSFNLRKFFIKKFSPDNEEETYEAVHLSLIYSNMLLLGCRYPQKLEIKINSIKNL